MFEVLDDLVDEPVLFDVLAVLVKRLGGRVEITEEETSAVDNYILHEEVRDNGSTVYTLCPPDPTTIN